MLRPKCTVVLTYFIWMTELPGWITICSLKCFELKVHHHLTKELTAGIIASSGGQNIQLRETILMAINCLQMPVKSYKANCFSSYKAEFTLLDISHLS